MVDIQSKEVVDKISEELKVQPAIEIPRELAKQIQLTYDVGAEDIIQEEESLSDATARTATGTFIGFTTPTGRDFFMTNLNVSILKDVACDITTGEIIVAIRVGGKVITITSFPITTLLVQSATQNLVFPHPIKLDRGSTITMAGTFTAGALIRSLSVQGFLRNPQ